MSHYAECRTCRQPYVPNPKSFIGVCGLCKVPIRKPVVVKNSVERPLSRKP